MLIELYILFELKKPFLSICSLILNIYLMNVFTATQLWRNRIAEIAKDYKGIRFAVANDESNEDLLKNLGLEESNEEINIGIIADGKRYPMEPMEEFDSDQIREFLDLYKRGKRQL